MIRYTRRLSNNCHHIRIGVEMIRPIRYRLGILLHTVCDPRRGTDSRLIYHVSLPPPISNHLLRQCPHMRLQ